MKRKYTQYGITESALKQLQAADNRPDGSLYPGIGYGAPASRGALISRGLAEDVIAKVERLSDYSSRSLHDTIITEAGRDALTQARAEGW